MKINLDAAALEWQRKARRFAEDELIPFEVEAEMNEGRLPEDVSKRHKLIAIGSVIERIGSGKVGVIQPKVVFQ